MVEQRKLGASELSVPPIGIGIMSWGDKRSGYGTSFTFKDILQTYQACLDLGLNYFDTAAMYGNGESERILGECRRIDGRPIIIATKYMPNTMVSPSIKRFSPRTLLVELDRSLQRLGLEQIDLFQLHAPPTQNKLDAHIDVLAEAVRVGKIRAVGICNFNAVLMRQAHKRLAYHGTPLASTMVGYNLLRRYPETNGVLDACRELDVALIAYAPLAEGILTGKYRNGNMSVSGINRILFFLEQLNFFKERNDSVPLLQRIFSKPRVLDFKKLEPLFVVLEEVAKAREKTIAQVALNWIMTTDPRIIPIPGAKNLRQARENIGALGWRLTQEEYARINQAEIATR